jgi:hypothetical protein
MYLYTLFSAFTILLLLITSIINFFYGNLIEALVFFALPTSIIYNNSVDNSKNYLEFK